MDSIRARWSDGYSHTHEFELPMDPVTMIESLFESSRVYRAMTRLCRGPHVQYLNAELHVFDCGQWVSAGCSNPIGLSGRIIKRNIAISPEIDNIQDIIAIRELAEILMEKIGALMWWPQAVGRLCASLRSVTMNGGCKC
ncbi:MAG: hypothetical protein ACYC0V_21535 [Armatimonadota bacterium]